MILLIDNYDSFTYNLYQMIGAVNPDIKVIRSHDLNAAEIEALAPSHIILSPGPGHPRNAGVCEELALTVSRKIPTLGVCLGHQAIAEAYGASITPALKLTHGKQSEAALDSDSILFRELPPVITVGRYHSLAVSNENFPSCLKVTARTKDNEIMALEHIEYPLYGLQFHPESILTPSGEKIIKAFLNI